MPDTDKLTPADPASALAFAPRFHGRNADETMAENVAKRFLERLERAGFVVMKRSAEIGCGAGESYAIPDDVFGHTLSDFLGRGGHRKLQDRNSSCL